METKKKQLFEKLREIEKKSGSNQAMRYLLNSMGSVPAVGGQISAIANQWSEKEQGDINRVFKDLHLLSDMQIEQISNRLNELLEVPSKKKMENDLIEIFGDNIAKAFISREIKLLIALLNKETILELQDYVNKGWLVVQENHSDRELGTDIQIENEFEDKKRNFGKGKGIYLSLPEKLDVKKEIKKHLQREEYLKRRIK